MKKLLLIILLITAYNANAQWVPNKKAVTEQKTFKVQCWGTTMKGERCKNAIDLYKPGKAVKSSAGYYYCSKHIDQAH